MVEHAEYFNGIEGLEQAEEYAREKLAEPKIPSMAKFNHIKFQQALIKDFQMNNEKVDEFYDNPYLKVMYAAKRDAVLGVLTAFQGAFEK
jgi:hypothetical protein